MMSYHVRLGVDEIKRILHGSWVPFILSALVTTAVLSTALAVKVVCTLIARERLPKLTAFLAHFKLL